VLTPDFGGQGDGFWVHGPGVTVEDNVVSGATGHGYIYWTLGLVERGLGENLVDAGRVPNGDRIGPAGETPIRPKQVPVPSFDGNVAYNVPKGLNIAYLHTDNRDDNDEHFVLEGLLPEVPQDYENLLQSTFSNFTAWNVPLSGVAAPYSGRLTFENIELIGTGAEGSIGLKLDQFANDNDLTVRNIKIDGYLTGIAAPRQGNGVIDNAEISAITGIRINVPDNGPRDLQLSNLRFLPLSDLFDSEDADGQVSIDMNAAFDIGLAGGLFGIEEAFFDEPNLLNVPGMFQKDRITLSNPGEGTFGLYFDVQDPGFIPVPVAGELSQYVREELVGLTNQQLQDDFGFSFSDAVTPETATQHPLVQGGLAGPALQPFAAFPPARDTYWVDYLASLGVDSPGFGSGGPGMGDPGDGDPGDDSMDDSPVDDDDLEDEMPVDDDDSMDDHFAEDDGFDEDPGDDSMDDSPVDDDDLEDEMPVDDDEPMDDDFDGEDDFDGDPSDNDSMDESPVDDDDLEDEMPGDDDESMDEHFDEDDEVDEDFHNDMMPEDVNADSVITARDALMIINRIVREALGVESGSQSAFPDVNNDGRVTALDALLVINAIGRLIDLDADVEPASHDEGMEALDTVFRDEDNEFVEPIEDALF
ncbi:MAG: dockerin type I domain-containing protein, partial [Planctomycetota bacterium]